ncbi:ribonuclease TUDOR 1 [Pelomyxa schiedti]|nr:ribonuclease TUDOR 1 [Pelomyxa schiedti]
MASRNPRSKNQKSPSPTPTPTASTPAVGAPTTSSATSQLSPQQQQQLQQQQLLAIQQQAQPPLTFVQRVKESVKGVVRAVLSGDSFVIMAVYKNDPTRVPVEKTVSLSGVQAPRLGKVVASATAQPVPDEPFAWDSREFLRKKIIGQTIFCTVEYVVPQGREFVSVVHQGENLAVAIVRAGLAHARSRESTELQAAEEEAKAAKRGMHNPAAAKLAVRPIYDSFDSLTFFEENRHAPMRGIVEQARTGSVLRVTALPSFRLLTVILAGVACPAVRWVEKTRTLEADPFGKEARAFVEQHLLHRDVVLTLHSVDKNNDIVATVQCSGRDVGSELVSTGFGSYAQWSAPTHDPTMAAYCTQLQALQGKAKTSKLGIWSTATTPATSAEGVAERPDTTVEGLVVDITTPGLFTVQTAAGDELKVSLSSVTVPRMSREDIFATVAAATPEALDPEALATKKAETSLALEAREFLRKKIFGKKVVCKLDYERTPTVDTPQRNMGPRGYYTVLLEHENIAETLLSMGYAKTVNHRSEESCSQQYSMLCMAEKRAEKALAGWWNPKAIKLIQLNDLTQNQSQAQSKRFLPFLERGEGVHRAIVEYTFSATRLKLFIPSQSCMIAFCLSAVRAPAKDDTSKKMYSDRGLAFTKSLCHLQEVKIEVEGLDKGGNFLGNLTILNGNQNLAVLLAAEGLVTVSEGASRSPQFHTLASAEAKAKSARKNLWEAYESEESNKQVVEVVVSEIRSLNDFYVQIATADSANTLSDIRTALSSLPPSTTEFTPSQNQYVGAMYAADNCWYRAQVLHVVEETKSAHVIFIDYGNTEEVQWAHMQPLPEEHTKFPAQAIHCALAGCASAPTTSPFYNQAITKFTNLVKGKTMKATVEHKRGPVMHITLTANTLNVNAELVKAGLCHAESGHDKTSLLARKMLEAQDAAREARAGLWQDRDDDEEEDSSRKPRGRSKS